MNGIDIVLIDAATKVFNLLMAGFTFKQKGNQDLYNDFVVPAAKNFEDVHQNYLTTLAKYQKMIQETNIPINAKHPVINEITNDAIFSGNLRAKSRALNEYHQDEVLGDLVVAVMNYFGTSPLKIKEAQELASGAEKEARREEDLRKLQNNPIIITGTENFIRSGLSVRIQHIYDEKRMYGDEVKSTQFLSIVEGADRGMFDLGFTKRNKKRKEAALNEIQNTVVELQARYAVVINEFEKLRKKLLR